jgi:hypothetical protein
MDKITIFPEENVCFICGKEWKQYKSYYTDSYLELNFPNMRGVNINTAHGSCRSLEGKICKLKKELCDLEYKMFLKKFT